MGELKRLYAQGRRGRASGHGFGGLSTAQTLFPCRINGTNPAFGDADAGTLGLGFNREFGAFNQGIHIGRHHAEAFNEAGQDMNYTFNQTQFGGLVRADIDQGQGGFLAQAYYHLIHQLDSGTAAFTYCDLVTSAQVLLQACRTPGARNCRSCAYFNYAFNRHHFAYRSFARQST